MPNITLTIDGRSVTVERGTTVLAAARQIGVEIPTLCFLPDHEPAASCFLCAVQVSGKATLSPSCATPADDGMTVETQSADVRAARRMAIELLLSDHAGDCVAPCSARCPAGLNIPGFLFQWINDQPRRSIDTISERLPLAGSLGRICPRLCENSCRRSGHDSSLAIGELHRHIADTFATPNSSYTPTCRAPSGKRVAIVGAGPAGLSAAWFLLQHGHACTLYDAHPEPGGMLRYGIPAYRLPRSALSAEIDILRRMGAKFVMNRRWGEHFSLADLRSAHDAVFIAIGAQRSAPLGCDGDTLALSGIEFLHRVACGERPAIGDDVIVVGGGNTAMDAARSAVRLGATRVRVLYRRTRTDMPCLADEADAAEHEGVGLEFLVAPVRIERIPQGRVLVTCRRMRPGAPDASGRPRPEPVPDSDFSLTASSAIAAVGQNVDLSAARRDGLAVTKWGIAADPRTLGTNLSGVFAGGDGVSGPDLAVRAVAAGFSAAQSIDQFLGKRVVAGPETSVNVAMRGLDEGELAAIFRNIDTRARVAAPELDMQRRRTSFDEVVGGLSPVDVRREASRCMSCGCAKADTCTLRRLATEYGVDPYRFAGERRRFARDDAHPDVVFEPGKCIMCEACVRVAEKAGEALGLAVIGRGFQVTVAPPFDASLADALRTTAAQCAAACPTGALALRGMRCCDGC